MKTYIFEYQCFIAKQPIEEGFETVEGSSYWPAYWKARKDIAERHLPKNAYVIIKIEWSKIFS